MRLFLLIVLAVATVWDGFTTIFGTIQILGNTAIQIAASILFSALIFAFVLNTKRIMMWRGGLVSGITKFFWFVAVSYDLYTSWIGNSMLVIRSENEGDAAEIFILIGLTLLVTASPIILSSMVQRSPRPMERNQVSQL